MQGQYLGDLRRIKLIAKLVEDQPMYSNAIIEAEFAQGQSNQSWLLKLGQSRAVLRINNPKNPILGASDWIQSRGMQVITDLSPEVLWQDAHGQLCRYINSGTSPKYYDLGRHISGLHQQTQGLSGPRLSEQYQHYQQIAPHFDPNRTLLSQVTSWEATQLSLCHMDLNPNNLIWDGKRWYCIDWEYARCTHPAFDLAELQHWLIGSDWNEFLQGYREGLEEITFNNIMNILADVEVVYQALIQQWQQFQQSST